MAREVVVNGRFLSRRVTGVERYGREILSCISNQYRLEKTGANGFPGHWWEQFVLPGKVGSNSILWSPANSGPLMVRNQALTIHDLSPLEHPHWFQRSFVAWYRLFLPILARRVRVVFTPTYYVKRKVCARFNIQNVIVTPNGVDPKAFHPDAHQGKYDLPSKYVLFVGTLEPRKNLNGLLKAWNAIKKDFKEVWLIVAGAYGQVFRPLRFAEELDRVRFIGYVQEEDLPGLYVGATLFVLPSFEEGFGLPALEAMACGAPVLVSNADALCEVFGNSAFVFDLSQPDNLSSAMRECLENDSLRLALREKGLARTDSFSWQKTADVIWKTLNET
jgi:glycosyltransferase involved in cell wall biosynthesis